MLSLIKEYKQLGKSMMYLIIVQFFIQMVNVLFISILPLYMTIEGYKDAEYAHYTSYRYLGMLALAIPMGIYIKGRKLLPLIYIAAIGVPLFALLILFGVHLHSSLLLLFSHLMWGLCYTFIQIPILPYILRNTKPEHHTLGITINFLTWSLATIISSIIVAVLNQINPELYNEKNLLFGLTIICFLSVFYVLKISKKEVVNENKHSKYNFKQYDWPLIIKALIPTAVIAFGAGFTIPFISLFFANVHHLSTSAISYVTVLASCLVVYSALYVPTIKSKVGYKKAVPLTQSIAIVALIAMATTQYYSECYWASFLAVTFFLIRQPFMNIAAPMTSEITMKYVGKHNEEITSGLTSAIWSGTTYFSAILFSLLRHLNVAYSNIFLITAALFIFGVIWFYYLIVDYEKRKYKKKKAPINLITGAL